MSAPVRVAHCYLDDEKIAATEIDVSFSSSSHQSMSIRTLNISLESHPRMPYPLQTSLHLRPSRHGAQAHLYLLPR